MMDRVESPPADFDRAFWIEARVRRIAVALTIGVIAALVISWRTDTSGKSMLRAGDFPGFYVLAEIQARGLTARLYDPELQRSIENELWPAFGGEFYMSVYPPYTALLLRPLALCGPQAGQLLFTGVMLLSFLFAVRACAALNPSLHAARWSILPFLVAFAPMTAALFGAQNTGLSMLLLSGASLALVRASCRGAEDRYATLMLLGCGVMLGAWMYKPQFPLFFLVVIALLLGYWRILISASVIGAAYYGMGAALLGWEWPWEWLQAVNEFGPQNYISNRREMISLRGGFGSIAQGLGYSMMDPTVRGVVSMCAALAALFVFYLVVRVSRGAVRTRDPIPALAVLAAATPLLSPQTLFYDLGISLVGWLLVRDFGRERTWWEISVLVVLGSVLFAARPFLDAPVFFPFSIYLFFVTQRAAHLNQSN